MSTLPPETPEPSPTPATPETDHVSGAEPTADNPFVAPGAPVSSEPAPYAPAPEVPAEPAYTAPPAPPAPPVAAPVAPPVAPPFEASAPPAFEAPAAPGFAAPAAPDAPAAPYGAPAGGATPPPSTPYGGASYAPGYPAAPPARPGSVMSIVSVVAGGLGLLFSALAFIPFVGIIAWPVPIVGLVLGFLGKRKEPHARGLWITGIILSGLALLVCVLAFVVLMAAFTGSSPSSYL